MLLMQFGFTYLPFMNTLFHSAPMPLVSWVWVGVAGVVAFLAVGLEKWLRHRQGRGAAVAAGA
jgi:Ca2+-transporting ATPase